MPATAIASGRPQTARLFHAFSDETRLRILEQLRGGERCVCELTGVLGAAQSRLSFHLKTLKEAGLIRDRRAGRWVYYSIAPQALEVAAGVIGGLKPLPPGGDADSGCC